MIVMAGDGGGAVVGVEDGAEGDSDDGGFGVMR